MPWGVLALGLSFFFVAAIAFTIRITTIGTDGATMDGRGFAFQPLMTIVTSLGLGPLTERDALMEEVLARALAAVERTEFHAWLDALPRGGV